MEISVTPSKSTSRYSTSSSSNSISTTPSTPAAATRKSMEEVWEHISLPNLHHPAAHSAFNGGMNLPDFLHKDPYPYSRYDPHHHQHSHDHNGGGAGFPVGCRSPPPATVLSLKSGHLDHFVGTNQEYSARSKSQAQLQSQLACVENPSFVSSLCKKRVHPGNNGDDAAAERRHKRLIKNRESAARSRARRQAYTDELEQEMEELKKENAKLRRDLEKVGFPEEATAAAAAPAQHHNSRKGHSLHRTLTAPF